MRKHKGLTSKQNAAWQDFLSAAQVARHKAWWKNGGAAWRWSQLESWGRPPSRVDEAKHQNQSGKHQQEENTSACLKTTSWSHVLINLYALNHENTTCVQTKPPGRTNIKKVLLNGWRYLFEFGAKFCKNHQWRSRNFQSPSALGYGYGNVSLTCQVNHRIGGFQSTPSELQCQEQVCSHICSENLDVWLYVKHLKHSTFPNHWSSKRPME